MHSFRTKLRTNTYLNLECYLPANKRRWCKEFVVMKIWNLPSLVCPFNLWVVSLTKDDRTFGWLSRLAPLILNLCLFHTLFPLLMSASALLIRNSINSCGQDAVEDATGSTETWISCFRMSAWQSARICSLCRSRSPNLFVRFQTLRVTCVTATNGLWTTTTTDRRQAFSFRVIGSSSARIEERLTDGDVIVVEVFREPLLGHGHLGELDTSLCNDVVVGLITCGRLVLGQGAKVPSGSARGCCPRHQRRGKWKAVRSSGSYRYEEKESEWDGEVEARVTQHAHETWRWWDEQGANLSQCVCTRNHRLT